MRLRAHLVLLVVGALLPVLAFSIVMVVLFWRQERTAVERGMRETTRALVLAVDRELHSSITAMRALATSRALEQGDLAEFHDQALRLADSNPAWRSIALIDAEGRPYVQTRVPLGTPLPSPAAQPYFREAVHRGVPAVSDLIAGEGDARPGVIVAVPVYRQGRPLWVLLAELDAHWLGEILGKQKIPPDWVAAILDRDRRFIARTRDGGRFVGQPAGPALARASAGAGEGSLRAAGGGEGPLYTSFSRSPFTGWVVTLAAPASVVDGSLQRSLLSVVGAGVVFLLLGAGLALGFGARIAASIVALARAAERLGGGEPPPRVVSSVVEVNEVGQALEEASALLRRRSREREDVAAALRESEERLRFALEAAGVGTWDWNIRTGKVTWSRLLETGPGFEPTPTTGTYQAYLAEVHPEDREAVMRSIARAVEEGADHDLEYRIVRPDGTLRWVHARGRVLRDEIGQPARMSGVCFEVTARRRAEEERGRLLALEQGARAEAEAAKQRAAFLAEASRILASSVQYETTLVAVARLALPLLGHWCVVDLVEEEQQVQRLAVIHGDPAREGPARELRRRYPPEAGGPHAVRAVLQAGAPEVVELSESALADRARDGEHLKLLRELGARALMAVPLVARGRTLGIFAFVRSEPGAGYGPTERALAQDLADRAALAVDGARLYRAAQAVNRAKDEFLATLSHELRTPLNALLGWARLLHTGGADEATTRRAVEVIERNTRALGQLVADLLDVSRIITGKLRLDVRPVDPGAVVETAIDAVRAAAEAKQIAIEAQLDRQAGPLTADPDRLQQIVWNLLSNAVKFTPAGGRVQVILGRDHDVVQIAVRDTGKGIPPHFLPYVFERFRQADSTTTRTHGGLGLGLAIVRHLVELHGGTVQADSAGEGRGATFTVRLPAVGPVPLPGEEADRPAGLPREAARPAPGPAETVLHGIRVLLVDDEPDTREVIAEVLGRRGAEVTAVGSAPEALAILDRLRPDILVSDIAMPGEDGYSLIRKIRSRSAGTDRHLPALALTAYARREDRDRALELGYQMYLTKPVEPDELASAVAALTGRFRPTTRAA